MSAPPLPTDAGRGFAARVGTLVPTVLSSLGAVAIALLAGAVVIVLSGQDPILAYRAMLEGALAGKRPLAETLVAATPLILGGLAFAVAAQAGLFNIGIEGQMMVGGMAAGLAGAAGWPLPAVIYLPLAIVIGALAGGIWGGVPGYLKAKTGAHEVITTIMLNYLAIELSIFVLNQQDHLPVRPDLQATEKAVPAALLPKLLPGTRLHGGLILALLGAVALWYLLYRTTLGYKLRTVGQSRGAAAYAGISWGRAITLAMFLSGVLGGIAGASEALGLQGRYYGVSTGYGYTAIAVGLVGGNNPFGVIFAGLLFGALSAGANRMQATAGTSKDLVSVLLGLVILSVSAFAAIDAYRRRRKQAARARSGVRDRASAGAGEPEVERQPEAPAL
ncbi:MAG TPA: ABC transporter permease [Thermomicrobiales bacterium]|nr:ABC transporter permease [Thermomicrobiales bacterium]